MKWLILSIVLGVLALLGSFLSVTNLGMIRAADEYLEKQLANGANLEALINKAKESGYLETTGGAELVKDYERWVEYHRDARAGCARARRDEVLLIVASLGFFAGAAVALRKYRKGRRAATAG